MSLVLGVGAVNAGFLAVGYALLGPPRRNWSWAGVALLVGGGAVGTAVFLATIAGARASLLVAGLCAVGLLVLGLVVVRGRTESARQPATAWTRQCFGTST